MTGSGPDTSVEEDQSNAAARRAKGEFVRGVSGFRHAIGDSEFPAEPGRYHLHVALNCPWCNRVVLARNMLGLTESITMDVVYPNRTGEDDPEGPNLWAFTPGRVSGLTGAPLPECTRETATGRGVRLAKEIYRAEGSQEQSLPILYDKRAGRIVNNESAEIVRMLGHAASALGSTVADGARPGLYPDDTDLRSVIDALNAQIYTAINNGAYKARYLPDQSSCYAQSANAAISTRLARSGAPAVRMGGPFLYGAEYTPKPICGCFPTLYATTRSTCLRIEAQGRGYSSIIRNLWRRLFAAERLRPCPVSPTKRITDRIVARGYFGRSWNGERCDAGPFPPMPLSRFMRIYRSTAERRARGRASSYRHHTVVECGAVPARDAHG